MLRNYFKIAYRNLVRQKGFSLINIIGLTVGLTCCFLILIFVRHELSYDVHHPKVDRIYRMIYLPKFAGMEQFLPLTPPPASPLLPSNFSEIEKSARLYQSNATVQLDDRRRTQPVKFDEERFFFGDPAILDILGFAFLQGNPQTALKDRFSVVVTDQIARKYFGKADPMGKTLVYEGKHPMKVTGVVKEFPDNTHLHVDLLANYETMFATESEAARQNLPQNWIITHSSTYVLLRPGASPEAVNARFAPFIKTHAPKELAGDIVYKLQPVRDIHLQAEVDGGLEPSGSMTTLYVFLGIAAMTLLIAGINFVNLSTARSLKRAKEVGVRKVLGSEKKQLIGQFLGESLLLSALALLLSFVLIAVLLPVLNNLTNKQLTIQYFFSDGVLIISFVGIAVLAGLLSGIYPAFFVSAFRPIETLKGNFVSGRARGGAVRQGLLVVQFVASIALMIGTLVTFRQLQYLQSRPLGFEKDFIITANTRNERITNIFADQSDSSYLRLKTFKQVLLKNPGIRQVTLSTQQLGQGAVRRHVVPEGAKPDANMFVSALGVDFDFVPTYGLKLAAGRTFSEAYGTDKQSAFLINEAAVRQFGWKSAGEALGKNINLEGKQGKVIGVLKDFHERSLHSPIGSMLMTIDLPLVTQFSVKLQGRNLPAAIDYIRREWNRYFPEKGFAYEFLDKNLERLYEREQRMGRLVGYFAGLAVFISCLGLFGLVSLVIQQKTKEIGIRKVLGASVSQVVGLLSKDFLKLVFIAILIASPIAWYAMDRWLQDFAFHIDLEWWMFVLAGVTAVGIAFLTVSFQSIKAALMNPVKSLRTE